METVNVIQAYSNAILCPNCNRIYNPEYLLNMVCPNCGEYMTESDVVMAVNKENSYDYALKKQAAVEKANSVKKKGV